MDIQVIDRCMDFCEGNRKKGIIKTNIKNEHFPQNLLEGNMTEQKINNYLEKGLSTREIGKKMGIAQPAVMSHIKYYQKGVSFYNEWVEFWDFIEPVRNMNILDVLGDYFYDTEKRAFRLNKIQSIGDFLMLFVQHTLREISYMKIRLGVARKDEIFAKLREMMYCLIEDKNEEVI